MTYAQALAELQQRGIDALTVAANAQLASIQVTRDVTLALTAPSPIAAMFGSMTAATSAFSFALLEQQLAYAKSVSDTLAGRPIAVPAPLRAEPVVPEPPATLATAEPLPATAAPRAAVTATVLDDLRIEQQRDHEVLSKTLPAPSGTLPAPRTTGFAARTNGAPFVKSPFVK